MACSGPATNLMTKGTRSTAMDRLRNRAGSCFGAPQKVHQICGVRYSDFIHRPAILVGKENSGMRKLLRGPMFQEFRDRGQVVGDKDSPFTVTNRENVRIVRVKSWATSRN